MNRGYTLRGGCSCGRNEYIVRIPQDASEVAKVFFDDSHAHRRSQATPISAWLRVPLSWHQSTTYAYFDDETRYSIRRIYTSPNEQASKRHFCGFCGTPLAFWSESPPSEADYISLTLGSLASSHLRDLEELGLLPNETPEEQEDNKAQMDDVSYATSRDAIEGLPWFESMIEGSKLGNIRRSWGTSKQAGGRYKVEWEIVEWTDEAENETAPPGKRKIGEIIEDDAVMNSTE